MKIEHGRIYAADVTPLRPGPSGYKMAKKADRGEIYLYGIVGGGWFGDGVTANQFIKDLKALGDVKNIDIRINSPGGDVFEGRAIYNNLKMHKARKTVYIDAEAASIASLIAMAGDEIVMLEGTFMMIHNAWGVCIGNAMSARRFAAELDAVDQTMIDTYAKRTGNDDAKIRKWMEAAGGDGTWMTADEAVERGFADKTAESMKVAAFSVDRKQFHHGEVPSALLPRPRRDAAVAAIAAMKRAATR